PWYMLNPSRPEKSLPRRRPEREAAGPSRALPRGNSSACCAQKRKGSKVGNGELNGKVRLTRLFCPLLWLALGAECGVERLPRVGASARHPAMAEVPASALSAWRRSIPGKLRSPP